MKTKKEWIIATTPPPVNSREYSATLKIKVDGKESKGYYDGFLKKWFKYIEYDMTEETTPSHWLKFQTSKIIVKKK